MAGKAGKLKLATTFTDALNNYRESSAEAIAARSVADVDSADSYLRSEQKTDKGKEHELKERCAEQIMIAKLSELESQCLLHHMLYLRDDPGADVIV